MLQGIICDYLSQLCTFTKQIAFNVNSAQSLMTISNNVVLWMIISGLAVSLLAGLAFTSLYKKGTMTGSSGIVIIFTAVGMVVLQSSELAYLVIIKFISISLMAVAGESEIDTIVKLCILASIGFLLLIVQTRFHNQAFPAIVTDVAVATLGMLMMRAVKYLPPLIPFILLGIVVVVLHNHGMGADVLTEINETVISAIIR
jgi:hypothetical protein